MKNHIDQGRDPEYYCGVADAIHTVAELMNMDVPAVSALKTVLEDQEFHADEVIGKMSSEEMFGKVRLDLGDE